MAYDDLDDKALHQLTRRRLQERPTDDLARQVLISELLALGAEIAVRVKQRKVPKARSATALTGDATFRRSPHLAL
jgi:hypothetical protein